MTGVLEGFATVAVVILVGAALAHVGFFDEAAQRFLARLSFFVASPALLLTTIAATPTRDVLSTGLLATVAGVVVCAAAYITCARLIWRRGVGDTTIGALASSYVNAGNLGLPIAAYALGNISYAAPTLLLQLLVLQPSALAVLDADRTGHRPNLRLILRSPLTNPLTLGALGGLVLSVTGWHLPAAIGHPLTLIGNIAVPAMLLAYGIALRLGPGLGGGVPKGELALTTVLKAFVQPLVVYAVARGLLGIEGHALLALVVMSALPTAQNIFVHATRFERATTLARDTILLTTALSVPVVVLTAALVG